MTDIANAAGAFDPVTATVATIIASIFRGSDFEPYTPQEIADQLEIYVESLPPDSEERALLQDPEWVNATLHDLGPERIAEFLGLEPVTTNTHTGNDSVAPSVTADTIPTWQAGGFDPNSQSLPGGGNTGQNPGQTPPGGMSTNIPTTHTPGPPASGGTGPGPGGTNLPPSQIGSGPSTGNQPLDWILSVLFGGVGTGVGSGAIGSAAQQGLNNLIFGRPGQQFDQFLDDAFEGTNAWERLGGNTGAGSVSGQAVNERMQIRDLASKERIARIQRDPASISKDRATARLTNIQADYEAEARTAKLTSEQTRSLYTYVENVRRGNIPGYDVNSFADALGMTVSELMQSNRDSIRVQVENEFGQQSQGPGRIQETEADQIRDRETTATLQQYLDTITPQLREGRPNDRPNGRIRNNRR